MSYRHLHYNNSDLKKGQSVMPDTSYVGGRLLSVVPDYSRTRQMNKLWE